MPDRYARNAAISALIAEQINAGKSLPDAIDTVLGAGAYQTLADTVHAALRAAATHDPKAGARGGCGAGWGCECDTCEAARARAAAEAR